MEWTSRTTSDQQNHCTVLTLVGDIDHDARPILDRILARLPDPPGVVKVDMRGVAFMDAAGLRFLVELRHRQTDRGGPVPTLCGLQRQPSGVLRLTGLLGFLGIAV
jgi:anti-anti-sigma factor